MMSYNCRLFTTTVKVLYYNSKRLYLACATSVVHEIDLWN